MEENEVTADSGQVEESQGFDVESASNDLANDLFSTRKEEGGENITETTEESQEETGGEVVETTVVEAKPAPKTWPKEMHDHWSKTPKEVQDYWETREKQMLDGLEQYKGAAAYGKQMSDAVSQYASIIEAQGMTAPQAVKNLLASHHALSTSSQDQKLAYFRDLAKSYGIDIGSQQVEQTQVDPVVKQLQDELRGIKQVLHSNQEAVTKAEQDKISKEVNAFATDAAHPYFDEVADDIIVMLKSGASLQDAYDKAIWANPVTRAKEMSRLQQEQAETTRKAALEKAAAAKKAASVNIHNRDTRRTPTETKRATMRNLDDALQETMREIRSTH